MLGHQHTRCIIANNTNEFNACYDTDTIALFGLMFLTEWRLNQGTTQFRWNSDCVSQHFPSNTEAMGVLIELHFPFFVSQVLCEEKISSSEEPNKHFNIGHPPTVPRVATYT